MGTPAEWCSGRLVLQARPSGSGNDSCEGDLAPYIHNVDGNDWGFADMLVEFHTVVRAIPGRGFNFTHKFGRLSSVAARDNGNESLVWRCQFWMQLQSTTSLWVSRQFHSSTCTLMTRLQLYQWTAGLLRESVCFANLKNRQPGRKLQHQSCSSLQIIPQSSSSSICALQCSRRIL